MTEGEEARHPVQEFVPSVPPEGKVAPAALSR